MERKLLFRAWLPDDEVMVYSNKYHSQDFFEIWHIDENGIHVEIQEEVWRESGGETVNEVVYVKPNQFVMSSTGLKDKNGNDIYEGDWCRAMFRTKDGIQVIQGQIIMYEFMWCIDCTGSVGDDIFSINRPHDFEVIGNIYENPELLNN